MTTYKVSIIMIQVTHPDWKRPRYYTNGDRFSAKVIDARRFSNRDEAVVMMSRLLQANAGRSFSFRILP
jgi:hypothetical protein